METSIDWKSSFAEGQDEKGGTRDGARVGKSLVPSNFLKWSVQQGGYQTQEVSSSAFERPSMAHLEEE